MPWTYNLIYNHIIHHNLKINLIKCHIHKNNCHLIINKYKIPYKLHIQPRDKLNLCIQVKVKTTLANKYIQVLSLTKDLFNHLKFKQLIYQKQNINN